tara:strand:+ start:13610 stop:15190 length:1581 start_codon:yes stop_codon:yes gene_type:complete
MSKSITSNLTLIQNTNNRIDLLDQRINNIQVDTDSNVDNKILYDKYDNERFTGTKDYHFRFDYYSNVNNQNISENSLSYFYNIRPFQTEYIHANNLGSDLTIDSKNLGYYDENGNYIIRISTNILFNDEINDIELRTDEGDYDTNPYCYFINNKFIQKKIISSNGTHSKIFNFTKGWNRIDIFIFHEATTSYQFKFYLNPLNNQIESDVFPKQNGSELTNRTYIHDRIETFTAFFINSKELIPNDNITINNTTIDSYYILKQDGNSCNTINYEYEKLIWNIDYETEKQIQNYNIEATYFLDRIIINNEGGDLSDVYVNFQIDNNIYSCNEIRQDIDNQHIIHNLDIPINGNYNISHSLSNLNSKILNGYSIEFEISKKLNLEKYSKNLKISNNLQSNSIIFQNDGSIGIGTTNTQKYSLYVNNISNDKKGIFCSDDITILSDIRYKTDIEPIKKASEKLLQLNGVTYKKNGTKEFGLIAQEVKGIFPELINENENELGIKYIQIIALLIEGHKELKMEIDRLKRVY